MLSIVTLLSSCSNDDSPDSQTAVQEKPVAPLTGLTAMLAEADDDVQTRATYGNSWTGGENVALSMKTPVGTTYTTKNYTVTAAGVLSPKSNAAANTNYWVSYSGAHSVKAWYFGDGTYYSSPAKSWSVAASQTAATLQSNDFIYAPATSIKYSDATKALKFYHQLAKVTVRLEPTGDAVNSPISGVKLGSNNVTLTGTFAEPSSGNYGSWTPGTTAASTIQMVQTATGTDYTEFTALLIPQTIVAGKVLFTVTNSYGTLTYSAGLDIKSSGAGKNYKYTFKYSLYDLVLTSSSITNWGLVTSNKTFEY